MPGITHKQKAFATFYTTPGPTLGNARASAEAAGYSPRSAEADGPRLLRNAAVAQLVAELGAKTTEKISRKGADILEELARLGFSDITEIYTDGPTCSECGACRGTLRHPKDMPLRVRRAIESIEFEELWDGPPGEKFELGRITKIRLHSKTKGLELLGKNLKLFTDKVELSGNVNIAVVDPYAKKPVKK